MMIARVLDTRGINVLKVFFWRIGLVPLGDSLAGVSLLTILIG